MSPATVSTGDWEVLISLHRYAGVLITRLQIKSHTVNVSVERVLHRRISVAG